MTQTTDTVEPLDSPLARGKASLTQILKRLTQLRTEVAEDGHKIYHRWQHSIRRPTFAASALNLAHYQVLRHHDIRPLQRDLMSYGLSSLGRLEGRVLATLDATATALEGILGLTPASSLDFPAHKQFFRGERKLAANTAKLFGPALHGRREHIMVTLASEAAESPAGLIALAKLGMNVVRINCAHDDAGAWQAMIDHVRIAEATANHPIKILMDIAGPKCRTLEVAHPDKNTSLNPGDCLLLCRNALGDHADFPFRATCSLPVIERLKVGDRVYVDDGRFGGVVEALIEDGAVLRIRRAKVGGGKLKPEKGLNFPDTDLGLSPLTAKDLTDLDFVVAHADMVGYSFVEKAADIHLLQGEFAKRRSDWERLGLVAKIETPLAVTNLPEIIVAAAGHQPFAVMIARGDLAVEIGFERLAEMQEEILWLCEAAHIPAIWATQVLESLIKTGVPSRGEMTDAAMSARAECVMLNKGPNVAEAVEALDRLLWRMSEHQSKKTPQLRALHSW
ncbi:MAG: pyruvate kinase [Betaproteobacteria bacterium]|nr:pyruvate kinase [Betaproteobacteria bacterium]